MTTDADPLVHVKLPRPRKCHGMRVVYADDFSAADVYGLNKHGHGHVIWKYLNLPTYREGEDDDSR